MNLPFAANLSLFSLALPACLAGATLWREHAGAVAVHALSNSAASLVIAGLWQGGLAAGLLAVCMRLGAGLPAQLRSRIFAAAFAALACMPWFPALAGSFAHSASAPLPQQLFGAAAISGAAHEGFRAWLMLDPQWSIAIVLVWLAASAARGARLAAEALRARRLWRSAVPAPALGFDEPGTSESADASLAGLRGRRSAELCISPDIDRPCVLGFFRPRILIPDWLFARLTHAELVQVALHEQEHLRRMDDWSNLAQKLCLAAFPLNPALWWVERRLCAEREMACDDGVVGRTGAPRAYAACLAGIAEKGLKHRQAALSLAAWQRRSELASRVHRLLRRPPVLGPLASKAVAGLVGCGILAALVGLARTPRLVTFADAAGVTEPVGPAADRTMAQSAGDGVWPVFAADRQRSARAYSMMETEADSAARGLDYPMSRNVRRSGFEVEAGRAQESKSQATRQPARIIARNTDAHGDTGHSLLSLVPSAVAQTVSARTVPGRTARTSADTLEQPVAQYGWLTLTTYEQTSCDRRGEAQGDAPADGSPCSGPSASAGGGAPAWSAISVTRIVLPIGRAMANRPVPSNAQTHSGVSPGSGRQPDSGAEPAPVSTQPVAVPFRGGWLVIQL